MTTELQAPKTTSELDAFLQSPLVRKHIESVLPKLIKTDRFVGIFLTTLRLTPKLRECSPASLFACLLKSAQCGLMLDGKEAAIVPFKNEAKFMHMYQGLAKLGRNSGEIIDIHADVVYENDSFSYSYGTEKHLKHKPSWGDRGKRKGAYSYVRLKDGSDSFEVMSEDDILRIRNRSEGWKAFVAGYSKTNPWESDQDEMFKKTAFRRHAKWLPMSDEYRQHFADDFDAPDFESDNTKEIEMPRPLKVLEASASASATPEPTSALTPQELGEEDDELTPPNPSPLPQGFALITAKYNCVCKSKGCGQEIKFGSQMAYSKTKGTFHADCVESQ